ncbi:hypothetical protein A3848_17585 [Paenibacillus sp. P32E]|nr:hypothetical protein A3848_17585 [Paenibacillus sp. P32E]
MIFEPPSFYRLVKDNCIQFLLRCLLQYEHTKLKTYQEARMQNTENLHKLVVDAAATNNELLDKIQLQLVCQ